MRLKTFEKLKLENKTVLLRVNFDVPLKNNEVADDSRIIAHLPTIRALSKKKAKIVLISHLGRPNKAKNKETRIKNYGLKVIADFLNKIQTQKLKIKFIESIDERVIEEEVGRIEGGEIVLLENLRFWSGEEKNDKNFAKFLAGLADLYINDAFPVCHRQHASVAAITKYLPNYAGLLLEKEIENLSEVLNNPKKPLVFLMGGAKVSSKILVIKNMAKIADNILIGGALANDFLKAEGRNIGQSLAEKTARQVIEGLSRRAREKIILPVDVVINSKLQSKTQNLKVEELNKLENQNFKILDIGQETIGLFTKYLKNARMIIWNGPMGLFEEKPFDRGTKKIAQTVMASKGVKIVIGGGDTIVALRQTQTNADRDTRLVSVESERADKRRKYSRKSASVFFSTGGGAMLEFLAGKKMPGITPLFK